MAQQVQQTSSEPHFPLSPSPVSIPTPTSTPTSGVLDDAESSLVCLACGGIDKGCQKCGKQKKFSRTSASTPLMCKKQPGYGASANQITSSDENSDDVQQSIRCVCHQPKQSVSDDGESSKRARNKLIIACIIALAFTVAEVLGKFCWGTFINAITHGRCGRADMANDSALPQ